MLVDGYKYSFFFQLVESVFWALTPCSLVCIANISDKLLVSVFRVVQEEWTLHILLWRWSQQVTLKCW